MVGKGNKNPGSVTTKPGSISFSSAGILDGLIENGRFQPLKPRFVGGEDGE